MLCWGVLVELGASVTPSNWSSSPGPAASNPISQTSQAVQQAHPALRLTPKCGAATSAFASSSLSTST